jgi:four helix bundle protein
VPRLIPELCRDVRLKAGGRQPADRLQACATSVGANYRASARARSRREFVATLGIVAEEADESVYWLDILTRAGLASGAAFDRAISEAQELRAIFAASYRTARRNAGMAPSRGGGTDDDIETKPSLAPNRASTKKINR